MKSMTGFGYKEYQDEEADICLELKSYNNRYLDVIVNLPAFLSPLESRLRSFLTDRVKRGRVELNVKVKELQEDVNILLDKKLVRSYVDVIHALANEANIEEYVRIGHLLKLDGVLKTQKNRNLESFWSKIEKVIADLYDEYESIKIQEGEKTEKDILNNLQIIEDNVAYIESQAVSLEEKIKSDLLERFNNLLGDDLDNSRAYSETAVLLVRYNINEEIVRLKSHISAFRDIVANETYIGKKLDFLCQELNREINTIGSKSVLKEVNHTVVNIKDSLEQIREQLRNVE